MRKEADFVWPGVNIGSLANEQCPCCARRLWSGIKFGSLI